MNLYSAMVHQAKVDTPITRMLFIQTCLARVVWHGLKLAILRAVQT